jgi:glycosyltransferase 2 family protein
MRATIARGLLALVLLGLVVIYVEPSQMLVAVQRLDAKWVLLTIALGLVALGVQWWKWGQLSALMSTPLTKGQLTRSLFGGFALGMISPGRIGEFGRAIFVADQHRPVSLLTALDRCVSAAVTMILAGIALAIYLPMSRWPLLLLTLLTISVALVTREKIFRLWGNSGFPPWNEAASRSRLWKNGAGAILFNLLFFAQLYFLLLAGGQVPAAAILGIPLVFAAKTLVPLAPMDLGVRETAAVFVLGHFGITSVVALQASLLLFVINVLGPGLMGLAMTGTRRWQGVCLPFFSPSTYPR